MHKGKQVKNSIIIQCMCMWFIILITLTVFQTFQWYTTKIEKKYATFQKIGSVLLHMIWLGY